MRRCVAISLLVTTIFPVTASAYTRGVYGKLEYILMNDNISDQYNKTTRKSFIQNYQLGFERFIYSPRLLTYDLGLSLYIDNTTSNIDYANNTTNSESQTKHLGGKAYLHFLKESKYPFTIFYERKNSPLWSTTAESSTLITYDTEEYGINGRVKLEEFNLHYEYKNMQSDKTESFATENGSSDRFSIGINKQLDDNRSINFSYSHETRDYYRRDKGLNYLDSWHDVIDMANGSYSWIISETLHFNMFANYMKNDYLDYEDLMGTISLGWRPNSKHSETVNFTANNTKTKDGTNNFYSLTESGSYKLTERLSTSHNFQAYNASGNLYNMTLFSATLGANYLIQHSESLNTSYGASVTGRSETYDYGDQNISIADRNMLSYTLSANMNKSFKEDRSNISAGVSLYQLISTTSDATHRVTANAGYNKNFTDQITYNLKVYSTYDNNTYTAIDQNETQRTTRIFNADTSLGYWRAVGYNGKLTTKAGVVYSAGTFVNRVNPYGTLSFFYMLRRNLMFKTLARVSTDTGYNVTSYTTTSDLIYRIRKVEMRTGIQWSRQTGGSFGQRDHTNYYFRISRRL
ncbi:MAG: hypothetical protein L3J42_01220 [Hydrogenimonas sp.]|nr:hypothetical protein [Hydrogenimonas sp.]